MTLDHLHVDAAGHARRPDFALCALAITGLSNGPSDAQSDPPAPGEVVWADDLGVTCRRWNWRQGTRTRLTEQSTGGLFLLERLEPMSLDALPAAADALVAVIRTRLPHVPVTRRSLGPGRS